MRQEPAQAMAVRLINDPCVSYWLKNAIKAALARDCVDALGDAEVLVAFCQKLCADPIHTAP